VRVVGEWWVGCVLYVAVGLEVAAYGLELECEVLERNRSSAQVASSTFEKRPQESSSNLSFCVL
jgi:hypothetical protein